MWLEEQGESRTQGQGGREGARWALRAHSPHPSLDSGHLVQSRTMGEAAPCYSPAFNL